MARTGVWISLRFSTAGSGAGSPFASTLGSKALFSANQREATRSRLSCRVSATGRAGGAGGAVGASAYIGLLA